MRQNSRIRNVVMLANGHPVLDTRIFVKEARSLVANGYRVSIIVPALQSEVHEGVSILAVPLTKKGWQKLIVNPWNILKSALRQPKDSVFHIHDSDILLVGVVLKLFGRMVVYDAHEDTPLQISYQHWLPRGVKTVYAWFYFLLEKLCGWMFDAIIVAEPVIARYFPSKKTSLVRNFPIRNSFQTHEPVPYHQRHKRLTYVGTLSRVRGLFEMLEGARIAGQETDFEFCLGGKFAPPNLEREVLGSYRVNYLQWVSYERLVALLFDSRIGIIVAHPIERYKTNYPVKLFEFMAAALPVIASREGEAAVFVNESQCGILVDPLDTAQIAEAIRWLFTHPEEAEAMGKRGQQMIFDRDHWENEAKTLLEVYSRLETKR